MGKLKVFGGLSGYKRIAVLVTASVLMVMLCSLAAPAEGQTAHNYAEAFQKSIFFYDAEKSGPGITGGRLEWRGDSDLADMQVPLRPKGDDGLGTNMSQTFINANRAVLDPDGNGSMDLSGGMHDAGDHVKFGLPQSYAASTLGWGYYHFEQQFQAINEDEHMLESLKWFTDYFLRSTFRNSSGDVVAFAYQVGEGSVDHTLWAPPELHNLPRPAYFSTSETPATDQAAGAAAALALMYLNYRDVDAAYANRCLDTAEALYRHARQYHDPVNPKLGYSGGFYNSSYDEDELSWAAVWLYRATSDQAYITDITAVDSTGHYTGWIKRIVASTQDDWQNIWVHSWDTVWGGVFLELAPITNDPKHWFYARWNLEYWSSVPHENPNDTNFMAATPAGYKVINTWGSNRYNATAQLQAMVYREYTGRTDFTDWAQTQMDYILGDNPMGYSYQVGYPSPEQSAKHPHHRAAHGSMNNSMFDPPTHRHVLWGALVGGPDTTDFYKDEIPEFAYSEVAVDYQAGFVGALAGMYKYYGAGQQPVANFPPAEPPETAYFDQGKVDQESNQRTQFAVRLNAIPTHPPHLVTGLKARYFFNISELSAYGQTISAVHTQVLYDEQVGYGGSTQVTGPVAWDAANGIYYVEMDWSANAIYGKRDFQLALWVDQASDYQSHWDPSNDYSRQGLSTTALVDTTRIPVYLNGVLVYGQEPGANQPTTPPPTTPAVTTPPPTTPPPTTPAVTTPPPTTQAGQGPYGGTAWAIPGTIQAENYDTGGEGVAYHDTTSGNSGNTYRTTERVDVQSTTDSGGGYNVGWTAAGEWLEYTVNVTAGGTYTLNARVASQSGGGTIHVEFDGANVTGAITLPSTGGWQTWTTVTRTGISLSAGRHVMRIALDSGAFNINWVSLTGGGTPPVTTPPPTTPPATTPPPTTPPATTPPPTTPAVTTPPPTTPPPTTPPPTGGPGCSPVTSTITVPFTFDGAGTFCWQTNNLGTYINSWNLASLTVNGVDFTNRWTGSGSYPPAINGSWYVSYRGSFPWSHFEAK